MYSSVKNWLNIPISIKPFEKRSGTGGKVFGEPYEAKCYPHAEVNIVRNWQGVEVVSNTKLYLEGDTAITKLDSVVFEGEELPVQAISVYYRDGKPDLKVVYV